MGRITTDPSALTGSLCVGFSEAIGITSTSALPVGTRLLLGTHAAPTVDLLLTLDGLTATGTLTVADVAALAVAWPSKDIPVLLVSGDDQLAAGRLWWRPETWGSDRAQTLGTVTLGPPGMSAYEVAVAEGFGGDFARNAPSRPSLFVRATDALDTMDKAGVQSVDDAYVRGLAVRGSSVVDPGALSDHLWRVVQLTIGAPADPTL